MLALVTALARAEAQVDSSYGARALSRTLERIRADTRLPDSLRGITIGGLDSLASKYFALLDDSSTALYVRAFAGALRQLPDSQCAEAGGLSGGELNLLTLLGSVDSATVDSLLLAHELALLAAARGTSQRVGTAAEGQETIVRLVTSLPPEDQQRFFFIAQHPPPNPSDACWAIRMLFEELAKLPPASLGPIMRRMSQRTPAPD